jgi:hypothetical protein
MEPTSNSNDSAPISSSPTLLRVLDALLEGRAVDALDRAALTEAEWFELRALARTANLTRLTLHQPDPTPQAEASALAQAQKMLAELGPRSSSQPLLAAPQESKPTWLDHLRRFLRVEEDKD